MKGELLALLICLLTVYAPIELTVVIANELTLNLHPTIAPWQFIFELTFIWLFYIGGLSLVWRLIKYHEKG